MIARIWRGRTKEEDGDRYVEYIEETGIPGQRSTAGNLASMILRRSTGDEAEFLVFSLWESWDSIRAFAGEKPEIAVYYPEDGEYLLEFEPEVRHFQVAAAALDSGLEL
ncbi:MAG: antibiotic biosynthesis monooxygenase [Gemmatimonadetes bacterium]|nr:antibiotic biosynthesis monooxygenase [Gemmatimonadota bacterium]